MKRLVTVGVLAACSGGTSKLPDAGPAIDADPSIDAPPARETVMTLQPLAAGELVEGIMHGGSADTALIHLEAPTETLDWNLHGHAGGGTQTIHEELSKRIVDYTFTPSATADWFLLLRNSGSTNMDVQVTVRLYGEMTWRWQ